MAFGTPNPGFSDALGSIEKALGLGNGANAAPVQSQSPLPFVSGSVDTTRNWTQYVFSNWNQALTYYLRMGPDPSAPANATANQVNDTYYFEVPPQSINVSSPFAISLVATNRGVLEEHNGVVFKTISVSGTTGVLPLRPTKLPGSAGGPGGSAINKVASALFPSVAGAIGNLAASITKTVAAVAGTAKSSTPLMMTKDDLAAFPVSPTDHFSGTGSSGNQTGSLLDHTGYAKAWDLHNFFMKYAELKKSADYATLRLFWGSPKDNVEYMCSPMQFDLKKDGSLPLAMRYDFVLKSWSSQKPGGFAIPTFTVALPDPAQPNVLATVANALVAARSTIQSAQQVIQGVNNDFANMMNLYAQAAMVVKQAGGLVQDVTDFPLFFQANAKALLAGSTAQVAAAWNQAYTGGDVQAAQVLGTPSGNAPAQALVTSPTGTQAVSTTATGGVVTAQAVSPGTTPTGETQGTNPDYGTNQNSAMFLAAVNRPDIGINIPISSLQLPASVRADLKAQVQQAQATSPAQIVTLTEQLQSTSDKFAQSIGLMDPTYAATYGLPAPAPGRTPTANDIITQVALQESVRNFEYCLTNGTIYASSKPPDPFVDANPFLQPGDQMPSPQSAFPVLAFGNDDLESLALRFLGSANRWREVALLNNFKPPYVDNSGFTVPITFAGGDQVQVGDATNLELGQQYTIVGVGVASTKRTLLAINDLGGGTFELVFNGQPSLGTYAPSTMPYVQAYLPNTFGAGDTVLMPSASAPQDNTPYNDTYLNSIQTHAEKVFKVDLALDPVTGDLAVGPNEDLSMSYGYNNAAQALLLKVETEQKELEQHPSFGLPIAVGSRNSDVPPQKVQQIVSANIPTDPRFVGAQTQVVVSGETVAVNILATGAEGTGLVPVTFNIGVGTPAT
jgi:hypothetical protein